MGGRPLSEFSFRCCLTLESESHSSALHMGSSVSDNSARLTKLACDWAARQRHMQCGVVGCGILLRCVCNASELFLTRPKSLFSHPLGCGFVTRGPFPGWAGFCGAIQNTPVLSERMYADDVMAQRSHRTGEGFVQGPYWGDYSYNSLWE